MTLKCDVLVIGGGPAGSTVSHILSEKGHKVVLLEKVHHPRFHIGESLLPLNLPILRRLGLLDEVMKMGVVKNAAEFTPPVNDARTTAFYFDRAMDKAHPFALQVRRAEFDHLLLERSRAKGTEVLEGVEVTDVEFRPGRPSLVTATNERGERRVWEAGFVVDASGRDTFLSSRLRLKEKHTKHQSAAVFGHFKHVERRTGKDEGNISIYWFDAGWFWMIPLPGGSMSVGAVCWPEYLKTRKKPLAEFLWDTIGRSPPMIRRMEKAELVSEVRATGNYSYTSKKMYGDGFLMIGDAFTFLDPVFSSGVYLAMGGGLIGAEVAEAYLQDPARGLARAAELEWRTRKGIKVVSWFIYRFTSPVMRILFMRQNKGRVPESAVISVLAGDFYGASKIGGGVLMFKAWYYFFYLLIFPRQWAAYLRRKRNVKQSFDQGTTPQDRPRAQAG